jgi:hypothetical protein
MATSSPALALGLRSIFASLASTLEALTQPSTVCCDSRQFGSPPMRTDTANGDI